MKYLPFLIFRFDVCYRIRNNFLGKTPLGFLINGVNIIIPRTLLKSDVTVGDEICRKPPK